MKNKGVKISIIGAGFVGSTIAYTLMMSGIVSEMVIVDVDKNKAQGEVMDLNHGVSFVKPVDIKWGEYSDTKNSDIIILTAGASQKPGETRLNLVNKNICIFKDIVPKAVKYSPNSILLVVTNPVDILSYVTYKISGFPKERVIGSGTVLDTSRFKYLLGEHFHVDVRNVHTYIMGEHGDSEITTWSLTNIAGMNVEDYCRTVCGKCSGEFKYKISQDVKVAAYEIIGKKGATYYAVALAVKRIVEAIIRDEKSILTISTLLEGEYGIKDMYLGVPTVVGIDGGKNILEVPLSSEEKEKLLNSAKILKKFFNEIENKL